MQQPILYNLHSIRNQVNEFSCNTSCNVSTTTSTTCDSITLHQRDLQFSRNLSKNKSELLCGILLVKFTHTLLNFLQHNIHHNKEKLLRWLSYGFYSLTTKYKHRRDNGHSTLNRDCYRICT